MVVLLPFYVRDRLGAGPEWYGFLLTGLGAGSVAGFVAAGALRIAPRHRGCRPAAVLTIVLDILSEVLYSPPGQANLTNWKGEST